MKKIILLWHLGAQGERKRNDTLTKFRTYKITLYVRKLFVVLTDDAARGSRMGEPDLLFVLRKEEKRSLFEKWWVLPFLRIRKAASRGTTRHKFTHDHTLAYVNTVAQPPHVPPPLYIRVKHSEALLKKQYTSLKKRKKKLL